MTKWLIWCVVGKLPLWLWSHTLGSKGLSIQLLQLLLVAVGWDEPIRQVDFRQDSWLLDTTFLIHSHCEVLESRAVARLSNSSCQAYSRGTLWPMKIWNCWQSDRCADPLLMRFDPWKADQVGFELRISVVCHTESEATSSPSFTSRSSSDLSSSDIWTDVLRSFFHTHDYLEIYTPSLVEKCEV